jgi:ribosomal protein L11 methyltransferase
VSATPSADADSERANTPRPSAGADLDPADAEPGAERDGTSAEGTWIELAVTADLEAVEAVSEILARHAQGGVSVEPAFELVADGLAARTDTSAPAVVRAYLPAIDRTELRRAVAETRTALGHLQAFGLRPIGELQTRAVHESDWAHAWKRHFPVLRVGRRMIIRPTWRRYRAKAHEVVLALDPGMAFGTGLHPTTRLCLAAIERWADEGRAGADASVLDVGCGSGVLAIAAGLLGAGRVVGVDPDPVAIEATAANAGRNRLAARVHARRGSLPAHDGPFDLVVANLIASLLVSMADALRAEIKPGGRLLASGIFIDREGEVREAFQAIGLDLTARWAEGDWVALELRPPTIDHMPAEESITGRIRAHGD